MRTFEDPHRGREVIDSPGGPQRGGDDGGRGHEIVGEGVVQVPLLYVSLCNLSHRRFTPCILCVVSWDFRRAEVGSTKGRIAAEAYLELKNVLHSIEFILVSASHPVSSHSQLNGSEPVSPAGMCLSAVARARRSIHRVQWADRAVIPCSELLKALFVIFPTGLPRTRHREASRGCREHRGRSADEGSAVARG